MASRNPLIYNPVKPTAGGDYESLSRSGGGFGANFASSLGRVLKNIQELQGQNADKALNREILARLENPESYEPGTPVLEQLGKAARHVTNAGLERAQNYIMQAPDILRNHRALSDETAIRDAQNRYKTELNSVLTRGNPNEVVQRIADSGEVDSRTSMGLAQWINEGRANIQGNVRQSTGDIISTNEMNRDIGNLTLARHLADKDLNEVGQDIHALADRYDRVLREHGPEVADHYQKLLKPATDFDRNAFIPLDDYALGPGQRATEDSPIDSVLGSRLHGSSGPIKPVDSVGLGSEIDLNNVSYNRNTSKTLAPYEERALPYVAVTAEGANPANKERFQNTINTMNRRSNFTGGGNVQFYQDKPNTPALGSLLVNADIENGRLDSRHSKTPGFFGMFSSERDTYEVLMNSIDQLPEQVRDEIVGQIDWAKINQANDGERGGALLDAVTYAVSRNPRIARSIFGEEIPRDFQNKYIDTASREPQRLPVDSVFHIPYAGNNREQFSRWRAQLQEQYGTDDLFDIPLREVGSGVSQITKQVSGTDNAPLGAFQIVPRTLNDIAPKLFGREWENMAFTPEVQIRMGEEEWRRSMNAPDPFENLTKSRWSSLSKERIQGIPQLKAYVDELRTELRQSGGRNRPFTYRDAQMITLAETGEPLVMSEERFDQIMAKPIQDIVRDNQANTGIQRRTPEQLQAQRRQQQETERQVYKIPESFDSLSDEEKSRWAVTTSQRLAQSLDDRLRLHSSIGQRQLMQARNDDRTRQQIMRELWGLSEKDTQNPDDAKRYRMGSDAITDIMERWRKKYPNNDMLTPMEAAIIAESVGYNTETDFVGTNVDEATVNTMFQIIADGSYEQLGEVAKIMQNDLAAITADLARFNELIQTTRAETSNPRNRTFNVNRTSRYRTEENKIKDRLEKFAEKYQIPLSRF